MGRKTGNEEEQVSCTYVLSEASVFNKRSPERMGRKGVRRRIRLKDERSRAGIKQRVEELGREEGLGDRWKDEGRWGIYDGG